MPIGIGMGLGNALMVVAVKERFADRPVLVTGVYASGIQIGAAIAAGLSVPVADAGDSWRAPMLVFSVAAAASLAWWLVATHGGGPRPVGKRAHFPLRKPVAWLLVSLFASTAFVYYGYAAWLPDAFTEHGWSETRAGELAARDQHLRDRHVRPGDARRRPLPLVAAHAARPAVRLLRGRGDRDRDSIRRTRCSGRA